VVKWFIGYSLRPRKAGFRQTDAGSATSIFVVEPSVFTTHHFVLFGLLQKNFQNGSLPPA